MKKILKKGTATLLTGTILMSTLSTTAFAAEPTNEQMLTQSAILSTLQDNVNIEISDEVAEKIANEIMNENYDYSGFEIQERGAVSTGVKTALKFIKSNWPKVVKILKKYGVKVAKGKAVTQYIDNILNGVIEVSDSIDNAIYSVVDFVAPGLNSNVKRVIANAIRLICPV